MKNKKLQNVLIEREVFLYDLAKATGISSVHASRILNGKSRGSLRWWERAAQFLEVNIDDILAEERKENEQTSKTEEE